MFSQILQNDYEIGHFLRSRIIPKALLYYTGDIVDDEDDEFDVSIYCYISRTNRKEIFEMSLKDLFGVGLITNMLISQEHVFFIFLFDLDLI